MKFPGYVNVDIRKEVDPDVVLDLTKAWPWLSDTFDEVASHHVLEHFTKREALFMILESRRVLRTGGLLVIECPDVKQTATEFAEGNDSRIKNLYGMQRHLFDFHRYGYWPEQMRRDIPEWGFEIKSIGPGTDYHAELEPCMRVEAIKL